jgi:hypothetical protein
MTEVAKVTIPLVPSDILEVISFPMHTWLVTAIMEYYTIFFQRNGCINAQHNLKEST